ncbi:hypothetical protein CHS0354_001016 [Potamilus streckersoni]|uniref:Multiple inositol polyphosphate phosphatase 1 n=1 Tax=Potamilus streckersoni TaxID=2493646 RepID=A0AAE0VJE6_9BIVA|nr:hypothetical protein CHS0354_001016 [Potamilus streckersoni]
MLFPCGILILYILISVSGFRKDLFSTRTSYFWAHSNVREPQTNEWMSVNIDGTPCTAQHVSTLIRHGAAYPNLNFLRKLSDLQKTIRENLGNIQFSYIDTWVSRYPKEKAYHLNPLGMNEQFSIGNRFGERFRKLFEGSKELSLNFLSSNKDRTTSSARSFMNGIRDVIEFVEDKEVDPYINDSLVRFYEDCPKLEKVTNDPRLLYELRTFLDSDYIKNITDSVQRRLGFSDNILSKNDISFINLVCASELASVNSTEWCDMIKDSEREVLEYAQDLEDYYERMYGHPVMGEIACPLVQDMFSDMDHIVNGSSVRHRGKFYFGHSSTMTSFYAVFGFFKEQPLQANKFKELREREFMGSKAISFSSNIALTLYSCAPNAGQFNNKTVDRKYIIQMFVNEEKVKIPICGEDPCFYGELRNRLSNMIDMCDIESVCKIQDLNSASCIGSFLCLLLLIIHRLL